MLARHKATKDVFAIKEVSQAQITKLGKTRHVFREKDLLNSLSNCPYVIKLVATTMDQTNLYFIFENCENGDLASLISEKGQLPLKVVKVYAA